MGIAVKKKSNLRVTHNEIANVEFQGISVVGDDPSYISRDVLIADNWIHDLPSWHTDAITIFNAENVVIRHNRIADTSWIGIDLRTTRYVVSKVVVQDNVITRIGGRDPAFAIAVHYDPPPNQPEGTPWPGSINDITIENNVITDCALGISVTKTGGHNVIRGNRLENHEAGEAAMGYSVAPLAGSTMEFSKNTGVNGGRYNVASEWMGQGNDLR
jgi:parallel beta-helix repeat protein